MAMPNDNVIQHPAAKTAEQAFREIIAPRDALGLRLNRDRLPLGCLENVVKILESDPEWADVLAYNEFALATEKKRLPPYRQPSAGEWTDGDDDELDLWLSQRFDMRVGKEICGRAVGIVARRRAYHPVRDYLDTLEWDQKPRLDYWLAAYLGAQVPRGDLRSHEYYAKVGRWWMVSGVARIYRPGVKADHVLMLEGKQGIGKSSALRIIFGEWFSDTPLKIGFTDSYIALRGVWGYELAELDSMNRAETSSSKAFFTAPRDKYRPPYGRRDIIVPRQTIFAGTVNHDQYLRDSTGNRRYWPVRCGELALRGPDDSLEAVRDQLWAEAKARFEAGEAWYPTDPEDVKLFGERQAERYVGDVWEALIADGTYGKSEVAMPAIFKDILDIEPAKMTRAEQIRVGECMKRLGWKKKRVREGLDRSYVYVREDGDEPEAGNE